MIVLSPMLHCIYYWYWYIEMYLVRKETFRSRATTQRHSHLCTNGNFTQITTNHSPVPNPSSLPHKHIPDDTAVGRNEDIIAINNRVHRLTQRNHRSVHAVERILHVTDTVFREGNLSKFPPRVLNCLPEVTAAGDWVVRGCCVYFC